MHVNSQSPLGLVLYGSPALSGVYGFRITLQGKGGHGSSPEICIDPITAGVHVHLALQELIAREVPAAKEVALTVGKFAGGLAANVIPDTCVLEGTLRGFDVELMAHLKDAYLRGCQRCRGDLSHAGDPRDALGCSAARTRQTT